MKTPKQIVMIWVEIFNRGDYQEIANLYTPNAINHQVSQEPIVGQEAIENMFKEAFSAIDMTCIVENIFEDGEWAILEWKDPLGLRGCGFFHVENEKIKFQRGYWDKLSFLRMHDLPIP